MEGVEHGSTKRKIIFERPPIEPYKQPNNSRSSDKHLLKVLKTKYVTPSDKSFYHAAGGGLVYHAAPTVWNELETLRSGCIGCVLYKMSKSAMHGSVRCARAA